MKKRSMLAIASLATGFVVAAVTPSHGLDSKPLGAVDVDDTISTVVGDGLVTGKADKVGKGGKAGTKALGRGGKNGKGGKSGTSHKS